MENQEFRVKAISEKIGEQSALVSDVDKKISEITNQLSQLQINKELTERIILQLKEDLRAFGVEYVHVESSRNKELDHRPELSKEYTLEILKRLDRPVGIPVKDIIEAYKEIGIETHSRIMFEHIEQLKDLIYQTNPNQVRGRKYRVKS
jgi:hypothetical protein